MQTTIIPGLDKTRYAPTPSGYLHIGNVLSFVITAALAQKYGCTILLRIDDTDRERIRPEYVQDIFDTLDFLGLPWHEGPRNYKEYQKEWSQEHRMGLYDAALRQLAAQGHVFACSCSRAQAAGGIYSGACRTKGQPLDTTDTCWRLHTSDCPAVSVKTLKGNTTVSLPPDLCDFVARTKGRQPAYQLASVIDDLHFGIGLIVRGADLWPSTVAQSLLAQKLGQPAFGDVLFHHHQLLATDGRKLSKSAGATSVMQMRQQGKTPAGVYRTLSEMLNINESPTDWLSLAGLLGI